MDPFEDQRAELAGNLFSLEFGPGGRISQFWLSDPTLPDEGEEFQFVLPPLNFGEEIVEDYYPGTILLGARLGPEEPWVLSRNTDAQYLFDFENESFDPGVASFQYEFSLLEEISATGRFKEESTPYPQVVWDIEIHNEGKQSIEIGELGFPMAFNNSYDGFNWDDEQLKKLWRSRLYIHKYIGGAASWLYAQRMNNESPGLLVFPGNDGGWEFYNHVRSSLNTPYQWEGIPVVYAHSRATIEREKWPNWMNEHTSLVLEPGDRRRYQLRFAPVQSDRSESLNQVLAACGRPAIRLLPGAVAPRDVGIAVEIAGASPKGVSLSDKAQVEIDTDDDSGFCYLRPDGTGTLKATIHDTQGRNSQLHLSFIEPVEKLIQKRAAYIAEKQVCRDEQSPLNHAILLTNIGKGEPVTKPEEFAESSGLECSLADAYFLACKNTVYPDQEQIAILDRYLDEFLRKRVQNPSTHSVASTLEDLEAAGIAYGRPMTYPHVTNLYLAMYEIARSYGETSHEAEVYLKRAGATALAMFRHGWRFYTNMVGVLGYHRVYDLLERLKAADLNELAEPLAAAIEDKKRQLLRQEYPFAGESALDASAFTDVFCAALQSEEDEKLQRALQCAFAVKSCAPCWWWYGGDKRVMDGSDSTPLEAMADKGEMCLSHSTIPNASIFFWLMDRDYFELRESIMRAAFGGMLAPWALVRADGAASMCFTPDLSSLTPGFNPFTGASGLGYGHYIESVGAYVLPNRGLGTFTFGCHFEKTDNEYVVSPWDGVGRRITLRQIGFKFETTFGVCRELRLDKRKTRFSASIENPADKEVTAEVRLTGLWGTRVVVEGQAHPVVDGIVRVPIILPPKRTANIKGNVE
jgi:hypothetical protein